MPDTDNLPLVTCHDVANFTDKQLAYISFRQAGRSHDRIYPLTIETCNFEDRAAKVMGNVISLLQGRHTGEWTCEMRDNTGFVVEATGSSWWQAVLRARALATVSQAQGFEFQPWVLLA